MCTLRHCGALNDMRFVQVKSSQQQGSQRGMRARRMRPSATRHSRQEGKDIHATTSTRQWQKILQEQRAFQLWRNRRAEQCATAPHGPCSKASGAMTCAASASSTSSNVAAQLTATPSSVRLRPRARLEAGAYSARIEMVGSKELDFTEYYGIN